MGGIADPSAVTVAVNVTGVPDATLPDAEAWSNVEVFAGATARDAQVRNRAAQTGLCMEDRRSPRRP